MAKVSGLVFLDGQETGETRQCVHCGRHWIWQHGSGRVRGYCMNCGGITCGSQECNVCVPWQKKMEIEERAAR
jgi:hypothetical protein